MFAPSYFTPGYFTPGYFKQSAIIVIVPEKTHRGGGGGGVIMDKPLKNYDEDIIDFIIAFVLSH